MNKESKLVSRLVLAAALSLACMCPAAAFAAESQELPDGARGSAALSAASLQAEGELQVSLQCTQAKTGEYAELVAVPNKTTPTWQCKWEVWPAGKPESGAYVIKGETGITLHVKTEDKTIGNRYRVTIYNEDTGQYGTSDWMTLRALDDEWTATLSYNPPPAGQKAVFKANTEDYKGNKSKLTYTWLVKCGTGEWYTPKQWENEHSSVVQLQTDPINEDDTKASKNDEGKAETVPTYQVRALVDTKSKSDKEKYEPVGGWPAETNAVVFSVVVPQDISAKSISKVVGCKTFKVKAKASGGGKLTYKSTNTSVATIGKTTGKVKVKKAGVTRIKIHAAAKGNYASAMKTIALKVYKKNTLKAKAKTVVASSKATIKVKPSKAFATSEAKGAVRYKKLSGNKRIIVSSKGAVKVKAGLKAGKVYKVRVKVSASGNKTYASASKVVTLKVKVK